MSKFQNQNIERSAAVVEQLLASGVEEFCVCAGSRNAPLISVLSQTRAAKIRSFSDEKAASFFALGRMQDVDRPVAVVCTSGTAVAELLPATIEAFYQNLPLVLVSADRPVSYRGTGAPQSLDQSNLLASHCEHVIDLDVSDDVVEFSKLKFEKPIHVNIAFAEPLLNSSDGPFIEHKPQAFSRRVSSSIELQKLSKFVATPRHLTIVGSLRSHEIAPVRNFLLKLKKPVWVESTSCLREDPLLQPFLLKSGEELLNKIEWTSVLRLGSVPSPRFWRNLENLLDVPVCSLSSSGFSGLSRKSENHEVSLQALEPFEPQSETEHSCEDVFRLDQLYRQQLKLLLGELPRSEVSMLSFLSQRVSDLSDVFLGNSLIIREWNLGARYNVGQKRFFANRGMNGIDGQLSSFLGATASKKSLCWGIFGDLTTLYDLNAPWILPELERKQRAFVVVNNRGGQIFSRVKDLQPMWSKESSRAMLECQHQLEFKSWAQMWKLDYVKVSDPEEFHIPQQSFVMEIEPNAQESEQFWRRYEALWKAL